MYRGRGGGWDGEGDINMYRGGGGVGGGRGGT